MRITFVLPEASLGGGTRVVAIYAGRLRARGHEVTVVSMPPRPPGLRQRLRNLVRGRRRPSDSTRDRCFLDGLDVRQHVLDCWRPVENGDVPDADVVVATWWETAEWVANLSPAKGVKAYLIQGDEQAIYEHQPGMERMRERARASWLLPLHRIAVAEWLKDLVARCSGDPEVSCVPNSVDTALFVGERRGRQREATIGMVYSTQRLKGCDISLRAYGLAAARVPGLRLVAFGAQNPTPELPMPAGAEYVVKPPQQALSQIYGRCDAWLWASRTEGFGLPILEAMACWTPVLATPAGAAPQLLSRGGGILVPHEDAVALADAIERIVRMPEADWRAMSELAHQTATSYSWDDATDLFEEALKAAIRRSGRGVAI